MNFPFPRLEGLTKSGHFDSTRLKPWDDFLRVQAASSHSLFYVAEIGIPTAVLPQLDHCTCIGA